MGPQWTAQILEGQPFTRYIPCRRGGGVLHAEVYRDTRQDTARNLRRRAPGQTTVGQDGQVAQRAPGVQEAAEMIPQNVRGDGNREICHMGRGPEDAGCKTRAPATLGNAT